MAEPMTDPARVAEQLLFNLQEVQHPIRGALLLSDRNREAVKLLEDALTTHGTAQYQAGLEASAKVAEGCLHSTPAGRRPCLCGRTIANAIRQLTEAP